eukprot:gene20420-7421_t
MYWKVRQTSRNMLGLKHNTRALKECTATDDRILIGGAR